MSSFTSPLTVELGNGKMWTLAKSFKYHIGSEYSNKIIKVPAGFETDFASVPKFFWFFPYWAKYNKSAPIHDALYRFKTVMDEPINRKRADDIFLEAMLIDFRDHKSGKFLAYVEYYGVRLFGWLSWK